VSSTREGRAAGGRAGETVVLKKDVSRDERWFAMALPGWFDPFGLKVISGIEDCGPLTRPFVVFNGLEVFFKIGLRTSKGFGKIFFGNL
jgi:hypothetical protein